MMQDYQTLAISYAEELSDLRRRYANLGRHCRGLESKLSKTRDRMKLYRERCCAWESALARTDEFYHMAGRSAQTPYEGAKVYGIAYCANLIRKEVEPAYRTDQAKIRRKVLNRTHQPEESGK